ncbi:hypothetical protein LLE49_19355 [Alicyclobacillus tolerans]|uniref:hypothetical protein n=1 Tax=Alicyclobacillus tolerans TaxID=90970 RepID=UPI001F3F4EB1|nr:hypothetical protein [Alicyclobacillus tolerans]MCF8566879.1 hypothetical protein [Alicyclobacillus tolerans]
MALRPLTPEELELIQTAKKAANDKLASWRAELRKNRKGLTARERGNLENRIAAHENVTGKPVVIVVDGAEMTLDYDLLKSFMKSLERHKFFYTLRVRDGFPTVLDIHFSPGFGSPSCGGNAALYELPPRKKDLLQGLPRVELFN